MATKKPRSKPEGLETHTLACRSFFDIPVYRVSPEQYEAEFEAFLQKQEDDYPGTKEALEKIAKTDKHYLALRKERILRSFGGPWQFNEIVGFVQLHFVGGHVRGHLWMPEVTKLRRTRKRQFSYKSAKVALETEIPGGATNEQVYETVLEYIERARKALRSRYLDATVFERVGPYIDWNRLRKS